MRKLLPLLLALLIPLAACGDDGIGPYDAAAGTYILQTVDGSPLPVAVVSAGINYRLEVTAGQVTLNAGRSFSRSFTYRQTVSGNVTTETEERTGTYVQSNGSLVLTYSDGDQVPGSLTGNILTITAEGFQFVFQK
ncbi:MAG TPA: hypothetical protein VGW38_12385 [Chloroflexota bacterium]|nr:hypothetical protein [Chloroflexota bacterium]